jgi:leader peptidase (prepilin peptidase)/N-methyltransferase
MTIIILLIGLLAGYIISLIINRISLRISLSEGRSINLYAVVLTGLAFSGAYLKLGLSLSFIKLVTLSSLLIIISLIDLRHQIIPDMLVIITLIMGLVFSLAGDISFVDSLLGMFAGGIILFILALVPDVLGGGDIKLMFAVGSFLGIYKTIGAIFLGFALSSVISIILLILKVKGRKDYIPFAPFLALGTIISFFITK